MTDQKRIDKGMWWDRAWTLTKGCTPVTEGCRNCWAALQSHIRSKQAKPPPCYVGVTDDGGKWTSHVEALPDMLDRPLHVRKPTTWAVWNDLFHEDVPFEFIDDVWHTMREAHWHTFQVLTKRPERMREYLTEHWRNYLVPYPNVWLGASASTRPDLERVMRDLPHVPAAVRFLNLEPLLGPVDLRSFLHDGLCRVDERIEDGSDPDAGSHPNLGDCICFGESNRHRLNWIVVGAESGPKRRPCRPGDARSVIEQCQAAGVPVFNKQMGIDGRVSKDMGEWPEDLRIRQMP